MVTINNILPIILIVMTSYWIGSIPTAYFIGLTQNINIFEVGSGNMGGTNIARSMGLRWGLLTIALDALKGMVAILLAREIMPSERWMATTIASIVAVMGHNWSLLASILYAAANRTRLTILGGKGGATAFGTLLMIAPAYTIVGMIAFGSFLLFITRYVSLGVLSAFAVALLWVTVLISQNALPIEYIPYVLMLSLLLIWRFRDNIIRIAMGTERRLGEKVKLPQQEAAS